MAFEIFLLLAIVVCVLALISVVRACVLYDDYIEKRLQSTSLVHSVKSWYYPTIGLHVLYTLLLLLDGRIFLFLKNLPLLLGCFYLYQKQIRIFDATTIHETAEKSRNVLLGVIAFYSVSFIIELFVFVFAAVE